MEELVLVCAGILRSSEKMIWEQTLKARWTKKRQKPGVENPGLRGQGRRMRAVKLRSFYRAVLSDCAVNILSPCVGPRTTGQTVSASAAEWRLVAKHQGCENMILLETVGAGGRGWVPLYFSQGLPVPPCAFVCDTDSLTITSQP